MVIPHSKKLFPKILFVKIRPININQSKGPPKSVEKSTFLNPKGID